MTAVGVGILGAGMISRKGVGPAIAAASGARVAAVGVCHRSRAAELAEALGAPAAYGSYEEVVADPDVEVVYVALPNDAHLPWILAALAAGKNVLSEKPLGLTAVEVATAFDAADAAGRLLVEASWYRWHPRTRAAEDLVRGGRLGPVTGVDAGFTFSGVPAGDYRMDPAKGGGAVYDVGCYALSAALWATGADLEPVAVEVRRSPTGVDLMTDATLRTAAGATVRVRAAIDEPGRQWCTITGTEATMQLEPPAFTAWHGDRAVLRVDGTPEHFEAVDPYRLMVEAVAGRVRGGDGWVVPRSDSEAVARAIDAVRAW